MGDDLDFDFDADTFVPKPPPKIDRRTLPDPLNYLVSAGIRIGSTSKGWVSICCPVHKGGTEKRPSMSVHLSGGGFKCHACGAKGGDVLALHRMIHPHLRFFEAVAQIGAKFHDQ